MEKINLKVSGMVCSGCENRIKRVLENISGVLEVTANHENGIVTVISKEKLNKDLIKEKIENLDFKVLED